eukprot:gene8408-biopygen4629
MRYVCSMYIVHAHRTRTHVCGVRTCVCALRAHRACMCALCGARHVCTCERVHVRVCMVHVHVHVSEGGQGIFWTTLLGR